MQFRRKNDLGRTAAALLASSFVMVGGFIACGAMIFVFIDNPDIEFTILFGVMLVLAAILWLLREKPTDAVRARNFFWFSRKQSDMYAATYSPRRRRRPEYQPPGNNSPPTAESIRELRDGLNTWVPKGRPGQSPPSGSLPVDE